MFLDVLKIALLVVLTPFVIGMAIWILQMGYGFASWLGLLLLPVPRWIRWIILIPVTVITFFIITFTFNVLYWIGDWYGDSFFGTLWLWVTSFTHAVFLPNVLVTNATFLAPNGRIWISVATMLLIWLFLLGLAFDTEQGITGFDLLFHGALVMGAISALWRVLSLKSLIPLLQHLEQEKVDMFE